MFIKKAKFLILFSVLLILTGCKDSSSPVIPSIPGVNKGLYILNEGLFGQNNSSISFYNYTNDSIYNNLYSIANGGMDLGDTGNDIVISGSTGFIAVSVSNKIEIIDVNTFKSKGFIDLGSTGAPRRIWAKDSTTIYVTSLAGEVLKLNTISKTIEKRIAVGEYPEDIKEQNGRLFVANSGFGSGNTVTVINLASETVEKTIEVGINPVNLVADGIFTVYAVCTGRYDQSDSGGALYKINSNTLNVTDSIILTQNPADAVINSLNEMMIINNMGVIKVNLTNFSLIPGIFIDGMSVNSIFGIIYNITYDGKNGRIYLANPKDFQQSGEIVIYDNAGIERGRKGTGINPGAFFIIN